MSRSAVTKSLSPANVWLVPWRDYLELCKPRVVMLLVFTAIVGMFLATPGMVPLDTLVFGTAGIALMASSAAAINHVLDRRIDAVMTRTQQRPLPTGQITGMHALSFAFVIGVAGMLTLVLYVNMLTALLTLFSLVGYAVVYTVFLKRATPQNIVIGGAAGAAPPVLGWTAVTGSLDPHALLLFLIIFAWTPPHFWALAVHRREEYARVGIPMLPVTHGVEFTRLQILLYTLLLVAVSVLPFATHMSGLLYLIGALLLGAGFLYYACALYVSPACSKGGGRLAIKTFMYSIHYLSALFALLLIDHYI